MPSLLTFFASTLTVHSYSIRPGIVTPSAAGNLWKLPVDSPPVSKFYTCRDTPVLANRMTSPGEIFTTVTPVQPNELVRACPGLARS